MTSSAIATYRLINQQLFTSNFTDPTDLVHWMGAMQAQDYVSAKLAVGLRVSGATNQLVENAIAKAEIIRTHVLRPTWHFVSPKDIYWMLELTAPHIKSSAKSRNRELGLTDKIFAKSNKVIEKAVAGGKHLTRDELVKKLQEAKLATDEYRSGHMLLEAELDGIICSGPTVGKKITYASLANRVPVVKRMTREESLALLAKRYFTSHGPATVVDFIWWSGLPVADAKKGLESVRENFLSEKIGDQTYWFPPGQTIQESSVDTLYLLPAFDEYTISYKDRSACLALKNTTRAISINGIFRPIIVFNGQVIGLWKRAVKKNTVVVESQLFSPKFKRENKQLPQIIKEASAKVVEFYGS
jgi:hypothetical protein